MNTTTTSFAVEQAAVWIVTDNANYDALGMLVMGSREGMAMVEANEAARAMMLVDASGIDITTRAIWAERDTFASAVTDPEARAWLESRSPALASPTPAPANPTPVSENQVITPAVSAATPTFEIISEFAVKANASSEYDKNGWSAMQAAGTPNTKTCGDQPTAWASRNSNGKDWLLLQYDRPVIPTRIVVYQTFNPGAVSQVEAIGDDGKYYTVYKGSPGTKFTCPYALEIEVTGISTPVRMLRVTVDQSSTRSGWNEIDAVQLVGYPK
jgi:hypothetical protein